MNDYIPGSMIIEIINNEQKKFYAMKKEVEKLKLKSGVKNEQEL